LTTATPTYGFDCVNCCHGSEKARGINWCSVRSWDDIGNGLVKQFNFTQPFSSLWNQTRDAYGLCRLHRSEFDSFVAAAEIKYLSSLPDIPQA
jgi:hypothetical protein